MCKFALIIHNSQFDVDFIVALITWFMIMVTSGQERCQMWLVITIDTQTFTTTKTPSQNC
jgi:hypothetical protein